MIALLQEYIKIDTSGRNPDYAAVVRLFKKQAEIDNFLVREILLPSGNSVLVISLIGTDPELANLALNHHMDVVPANNIIDWMVPPFGGIIQENKIYGRGTQDCKGLGVVQYAALRQLKQSGLQPIRTIHLILVPDEESGGFYGTKEFIDHPVFKTLKIGYVLDEGMPSGNNRELLIKVDERTPIQIRLTSRGEQSHASGLFHENSAHVLIACLNDFIKFHIEQQHLGLENAGRQISMQITSLKTNNLALNVIASEAQATIDVRIPSHVSLDEGIAIIDGLIQKHAKISYEIVATSKERCMPIGIDSDFYQAVASSVERHGFAAKSFAFEATTDARFYSHKNIETIGFTPFSVVANLHGTNECIRIQDFMQGVMILHTFLELFCVSKKKE